MEMRTVIKNISGIISVTADEDAALQKAVKILEELEEFDILEKRINVTDAVWSYYLTSQGAGHTKLLKEGIENYEGPFMIVIASENQRAAFDEYKCILYSELADKAGVGFPIIWDNAAIVKMVSSLSIIQSSFRRIRNILEGSN